MYMPPNNGGGDFSPPPAGNHRAVCYRVIDLGTQKVEFQGDVKFQRKIMLTWELCDELMAAHGDYPERPYTIHQRYTFSSREKAVLRAHLESWRGKPFQESDFGPGGFNIKNVLGKSCLLNVVHEPKAGKIYANLKAVSALPKGMAPGQPSNGTVYLSLDRDEFNGLVFEGLSDSIKDTIRKSPEYQELMKEPDEPPAHVTEGPAELNDDIPF